MPDEASELRELLASWLERQVNTMNIHQGLAFAPGTAVPGNPFGELSDEGQEVQFGSGYDGMTTIMPFILDISTLDGPDVLI